jgi:hypothetical protein
MKTDSSPVTVSSDNMIEATGPSTYALRYAVSESASLSSQTVKLVQSKSEISAASLSDPQLNVPAKLIDGAALSVELVNGNGVNGLAKQVGSSLPIDRWRVIRTANYKNYSVGLTRIEYLPHHADDARRFSSMLGIRTSFRSNTEQRGTLRIILGHDCKNIAQLKERLASALPTPSS